MMNKKRLAIVALGPSSFQYIQAVEAVGDRSLLFEEVWTVNTYSSVIKSDLVFHMDDIRVQMARAEQNEKIKGLVDYLRTHQGRVMTSRTHPEFPCLEAFPLEEVMNEFKTFYFNNTVAYALAYALMQEFDSIALYGCDYHYQGSTDLEPGRACLEYWLGRAWERGVHIEIASSSTLLDASSPRLYGYDTLEVKFKVDEDSKIKVEMTPRDEPINAEEIEKRYCHRREVA